MLTSIPVSNNKFIVSTGASELVWVLLDSIKYSSGLIRHISKDLKYHLLLGLTNTSYLPT